MYKITVESESLTYYQENLQYVKYQEKNDLMLMCDESEAQGILSQDGSEIYTLNSEYHLKETYKLCKIETVDTYSELNEINKKNQEVSQTLDSILTEVLPSLMMM